jgi:hypothetical protein
MEISYLADVVYKIRNSPSMCISKNYIMRFKARVCGQSPAGIAGSNPAGGMNVCLLCCVLSGSLCNGLIIHAEESYRLWCVLVCDLVTSRIRRLKLARVVNAG